MADIKIYGKLVNATTSGELAQASQVKDTAYAGLATNPTQSAINADLKAKAAAAQTAANTAQLTANTAKTNAATAQTAANAAQTTANAASSGVSAINSKIGAASGIAPLGADSLVPSRYLPSYVDDVLEFKSMVSSVTLELASITSCEYVAYDSSKKTFVGVAASKYYNNWGSVGGDTTLGGDAYGAATGQGRTPMANKIYVRTDSNKIYRWSGSALTEVSSDTMVTQNAVGNVDAYYNVLLGYNSSAGAVTQTVNKANQLSYNSASRSLVVGEKDGTSWSEIDASGYGSFIGASSSAFIRPGTVIIGDDGGTALLTITKDGITKAGGNASQIFNAAGGMLSVNSAVQTVAPNAVTTTESRSYAVQRNSSGALVVNVPWSAGSDVNVTQTKITATTAGTKRRLMLSNSDSDTTETKGLLKTSSIITLSEGYYATTSGTTTANHPVGSMTVGKASMGTQVLNNNGTYTELGFLSISDAGGTTTINRSHLTNLVALANKIAAGYDVVLVKV